MKLKLEIDKPKQVKLVKYVGEIPNGFGAMNYQYDIIVDGFASTYDATKNAHEKLFGYPMGSDVVLSKTSYVNKATGKLQNAINVLEPHQVPVAAPIAQPSQSQPRNEAPFPTVPPPFSGTPTRDFDKEARGKVRHGFAIEAFKKDMPLDSHTIQIVNGWVDFVMKEEDKNTLPF